MGKDRIKKEAVWQEIRLERITPEEAGVPCSAIEGFLDQIREKQVHLHSFMMLKGDKVFAEGSYAPCRMEDVHMLFSLSKSFTAVAVGFAVQEGLLSVEDRVLSFFEEGDSFAEAAEERQKRMTVRHLLTMNTGHVDAKDDTFKDMAAEWGKDFLADPPQREPGSWFLYNTRASYMLSVIVQKVTGETVLQYLTPRLFVPLGFSRDIWWELSPEGCDTGGFGLNLPVEDIARFGILLLNKGSFQGKRILEETWVEEASRPWSDTSLTWEGENRFGYGYQLWRCHVEDSFRGDGAYGQYCVVLPGEKMLFISTAGQKDMQRILDAYWQQVYSCIKKEESEKEDENGKAVGEENGARPVAGYGKKLAGLTLPTYYEEKGIHGHEVVIPKQALDRLYRTDYNILQITGIRFLREGEDRYFLELHNGKNADRLPLSGERWEEGQLHIDGAYTQRNKWVFRNGLYERLFIKGCTAEGILYMDMVFPETAYQDTWEIRFGQEKLCISIRRNTGFDEIDFSIMGR